MEDTRGHYDYRVRGTETDWSDRLQLSALFSLMQESAVFNAEEHGWGADTLDPLNICWVLMRVSVRLRRFPRWRDILHVHTWPRDLDRLIFLRDFRFSLSEGEGTDVEIGGATTSWVLVDRDTHRPKRPDAIPYDSADTQPGSLALGFSAEAIAPFPGLCDGPPAIVKYADACDIDRNLHVNNTRYVAWSVDAVNRLSPDRPVLSGIDIHYLSEVKFGDKILLHACAEAGETGMRFLVEGREAVRSTPVFRAILYADKEISLKEL